MSTSTEAGRLCRWCREPLRAGARVCPHCARWQDVPATCAYHVLFRPYAACAVVLFFIASQWWGISLARCLVLPLTSRSSGQEMRVAASEMTSGDIEGEAVLAIVGRLRNDGGDARRVAALEVQFADAAGRLVDVCRAHPWPLTVPPHGERAFRLSIVPELPADRYAAHQVFVRATAAPNSFF